MSHAGVRTVRRSGQKLAEPQTSAASDVGLFSRTLGHQEAYEMNLFELSFALLLNSVHREWTVADGWRFASDIRVEVVDRRLDATFRKMKGVFSLQKKLKPFVE